MMNERTALLTCTDVAERLRISRSFAYTLMQRGEIPTVRMGRAVRVRQQDLEGYIEAKLVSTDRIPVSRKPLL